MATLLTDPQTHLIPLQWQVLGQFFSSPVSAPFFLTGGTALAGFYFGHRRSIDLDLFAIDSFNHKEIKSHLDRIAESLGGNYSVRTDQETILTGFVSVGSEQLKVDVIQDVPVHFGDFQVHDSIRVDSLENIGSNKIAATYGRLDAKDFIDLYWILKQHGHLKFEKLLKQAKKKDVGIADFHLAHIFLNPPADSLFQETTPSVEPKAIRQFFRDLGLDLLKKAKKPSFG